MTENQEKELFMTLATLVTGMRGIQIDITEIKQILNKHSRILDEHSESLNRLEAKTDDIAVTVTSHGKRLDKVEKKSTNYEVKFISTEENLCREHPF